MIINKNTRIITKMKSIPIQNAIKAFERDKNKILISEDDNFINIYLVKKSMSKEMYEINGNDNFLEIYSNDELGFIYGIYEISKKFLGVNEFWFWNDQIFLKKDSVFVEDKYIFVNQPFNVKLRGWFVNDEVLIHNWQVDCSDTKSWEMVFETILRLGGNMVIPGTGKNAEKNRKIASNMGLYITHHHAEPLGAKMFSQVYPDLNPSYDEHPDKFNKIWMDGIKSQKDHKVIWNLGFRGQGDCPFWSNDPKYATSEERGKLIGDLIELQYNMIKEYRTEDICCVNLYGEVLELYREGCIKISNEIIKIWADNGFGKMVSRRQNNHNPRIPAFADSNDIGKQGIYYHVSFYDLQAANHITMLPNDPHFILNELNHVLERSMNEYWIINCSNVKPHTYYLDFIGLIWKNKSITVEEHQKSYVEKYFGDRKTNDIIECFNKYFESAISYGVNKDEHTGEQFINHVPRILITQFIKDKNRYAEDMIWATDEIEFNSQILWYKEICEKGVKSYEKLLHYCEKINLNLLYNQKKLFEDSLLLHVKIYFYCFKGALDICKSLIYGMNKNYQKAFYFAGKGRKNYLQANIEMRNREHGKWNGFYENDCLTDIKQTAWVIESLMGYFRCLGDGPHYYNWQRDFLYNEDERKVMLILNMENHLKDLELFELMEAKWEDEMQ